MNQTAAARPRLWAGGRRFWLALAAGALLLWTLLVVGQYYVRLWEFLAAGAPVQVRLHGSARLPYLGEALSRAGAGVGGAGVLLFSAILLGDLALAVLRWRLDEWQERLAYAVALGLGLFANLGLVLALLGLYRPRVLQVVVALVLIAGLLVRRGSWLGALRSSVHLQAAGLYPKHLLAAARRRWQDSLWIVYTAVGIGLAFVAALAPEVEYDALWFHLNYPRLFLETGRLVDLPHDYVSLYPMIWELWFGYGLALGGPVAAKLLHFAMLPLSALMVHQLARRWVPGARPWLAVALFVAVPTVLWEASTAYIDLALGFHLILLLYALLHYCVARRAAWLLIGALNLGLALATKHLALLYLALSSLLLAWRLAADFWRGQRRQPFWPGVLRVARPLLLFGIAALLLPLPWYVRSVAASGNPVFPELYGVFGAPPERWDAVTDAGLQRFLDHFGPERTPLNLLSLPWHMTIHAAAYDGALGPLFLLLLPGLALRRRRGGAAWLLLFVAGALALWASPLASFQMRFVVPLVPLLAVLAAAGAARIWAVLRVSLGRGALAGPVLASLLLGLNLPFFTAWHEVDRHGDSGWLNSVLRGVPLSVVVGAESQSAYLQRQVRSYGAWEYVNAHLPPDVRVLTWAGGDQLYAGREWLWANAAAARRVAWAPAGDLESALDGLSALGVDYLLLDRRPLAGDDWEHYALTSASAVQRGRLVELFTARGYTLYRVNPAPAVVHP